LSEPPDVTIVGAGLAGSLLATMFARRGMKVTVYEKRGDMRRHDISAGRSINLALAERGIHALKRAGVFDQIESQLVPMGGRMLHDVDGTTEYQPYGWRDHEVIYSVSRGALNKVMMSTAEMHEGVAIEFEKCCVDVNLQQKQLTFAHGDSVGYRHLIGADGAGSPVRTALMEATDGECTTDVLDHGYKELCIPAAGSGKHQIDRSALHIWPRGGYMLIALPNLDGSFTLTLFLANEGSPSFAELESAGNVQSFFAEQFPDALALIPELARDFSENPTGTLATVRSAPWHYQDSALILGDAAHAVVPFHGQGMNCAFEDCAILTAALDQSDDWHKVLSQFSRTRKPAADAIANMALQNYVVMREGVRQPKFHLKKQLGFELERRFPDRFIPRYSMVMFHRIPYDQALARGATQEGVLEELLRDAESIEQVDFDRAAVLIESRLSS
jgi:kynurenine 3-monooxygenase